jgi:outer membrane protein assembly factor BamB
MRNVTENTLLRDCRSASPKFDAKSRSRLSLRATIDAAFDRSRSTVVSKHLSALLILGTLLAANQGCARAKKPAPAQVSPLSTGSFAQQWYNSLKLGKDSVGEMYLRDDTLFVYSAGQRVYAISRTGGDLRYIASPEISGGKLRPPLVIGDYVLYPSGSTLEVFNSRGRQVKTVEFDKPTRSGAIAAGLTVYLGLDHTGGTGVLASVNIDRPYHNVNWEMMTKGAVSPTPAMYEKILYCGAEDGKLYAVTDQRQAVWALPGGGSTFNTQGKFVSDIKADDYGVYASNTDSKLYCLDRATGRIKWQYYAGAPLHTSPVVFAANVYQYVPHVGVVAIDKANGQFNRQPKWIVKDAQQVLAEDPAHVYLKARSGQIYAVDKNSGQVQFRSKGKWDHFSTNMTDAMIFAATKDGKVYGIHPVLREGEVGTMVMDFRPEPLALAR